MTGSDRRSDYAILLVAHGSQDAESVAEMEAFARILESEVGRPVHLAFLELADPPVAEAMRRLVDAGRGHIVVLPLLVGPAGHQKNDIPAAIHWARQQWPHVRFSYGTPLDVHPFVVDVLSERARAAIQAHTPPPPEEACALLLVGRGSTDPDSNSNLYKLARLLWEGRRYKTVEVAFYSLSPPFVEAGVERCVRLGAEYVVVVPHFLFTGVTLKGVYRRAEETIRRFPGVTLIKAAHMGAHPRVFALLQQRVEEALHGRAVMNCDLCKYRYPFAGYEQDVGAPQTSDADHGLRGIEGVR